MNRLTRVLVVFVAAASLAFAAFAIALVHGGPNWEALANDLAFRERIAFESPTDPSGSYKTKHRSTGADIKSSKNPAEVIIEGQKRILDDIDKELQAATEFVEKSKPYLAQVQSLIEVDRKGLDERAAAWAQVLVSLSNQLKQMNDQIQSRTVEVTQIQRDLEERRFEVLRLQNQLELLRDDLYSAEQQRDALENELTTLQESQQRLERRQKQLQQQLGEKYD